MNNSRLVYSTGADNSCPDCGKNLRKCKCKTSGATPVTGDGKIRIQRETKGRGGKDVTVVSGIPLNDTELKKLAKKLKAACGTGGTIKNGNVEIQGDKREIIKQMMEREGWNAVLAGA